MHKNTVLNADHSSFSSMEETHQKSRDIVVRSAITHIYGKRLLTGRCIINTGLSYGLRKVALSGYLANYPAIVNSSLIVLRITGSTTLLKSVQDIPALSMWFMTLPTFIKTVAL
jgi:hypothetical protein